ncbi:MAG: molybdopterin-guanine dinucleotide biosynthesis protein B [Planctomycetaceae bacterium]|nr:molybdopterin-guanine dinucleotide biosynthesis protein B [Planctomycetaceae bacterium]
MKRVHVIGRKNHGKTRLVTELVRELSQRGFRVGTIKHTHHQHELDTPGKDSWQHRQSGSVRVGVLSHQLSAVFLPVQGAADSEVRYDEISPLYGDCDLVIVEGNLAATAPKIEVWREELGTAPIFETDAGVEVVVTAASLTLNPPRFTLLPTAIESLADWVLFRLKVESRKY